MTALRGNGRDAAIRRSNSPACESYQQVTHGRVENPILREKDVISLSWVLAVEQPIRPDG